MPISLNDLAAFSEQDIADVLADELADSAERYKTVSNPTAILLAGQPGAGKAELASAMSGLLAGNVFFITSTPMSTAAGIRTIAPSMRVAVRIQFR